MFIIFHTCCNNRSTVTNVFRVLWLQHADKRRCSHNLWLNAAANLPLPQSTHTMQQSYHSCVHIYVTKTNSVDRCNEVKEAFILHSESKLQTLISMIFLKTSPLYSYKCVTPPLSQFLLTLLFLKSIVLESILYKKLHCAQRNRSLTHKSFCKVTNLPFAHT